MRLIDEIKAEYEKAKKCADATGMCDRNCKTCVYSTDKPLIWWEIHLYTAICRDIPLDRLEKICNAEREGLLVVLSEKPMCYAAPYKPTNSELLAAIDAQNAEAAKEE